MCWWTRREKGICAYLTRTQSSAGYFLHWHSLTKGPTIERSWVGAGPGTFLPSSTTANIAGWPLCPGRPASIHWERKMGRGRKKGERFLLIAYYVQATVPGAVSAASRDWDTLWTHSSPSILMWPWGLVHPCPSACSADRGGTQRIFFAGKLWKIGRTYQYISKVLENPDKKKKISAFEFPLL